MKLVDYLHIVFVIGMNTDIFQGRGVFSTGRIFHGEGSFRG